MGAQAIDLYSIHAQLSVVIIHPYPNYGRNYESANFSLSTSVKGVPGDVCVRGLIEN